jgi:hypothetical protein
MKVFNINDNYFKYQKCLSGITYQYVNELDDIYAKNLMVGTNYCLYCMYNEFDIINNFMVNLYQVDVCSTLNLDLTKRYFDIDGVSLRTGHRVILVGQTDKTQNDIYNVDSRGYLILSDELADTGKTWRYKAYVKLGGNKSKQFHLKNSGNRFPLKGEKKEFLEGHGYIIKSIFNYNLFYDGPVNPKLIFTDYELARISVNKNYELYDGFYLPLFITGDTIDIKYHNSDYIIKVDNNNSKYIYTGVTLRNTVLNTGSTDMWGNYGYETFIKTNSTICSNANVYDYVKFEISGNTSLYLKTFIKRIDDPYIIISDYISDNILNDYYSPNISGASYYNTTIDDLTYPTSGLWLTQTYDTFLPYQGGEWVLLESGATWYLTGQVISYTGNTGDILINITYSSVPIGTNFHWVVSLISEPTYYSFTNLMYSDIMDVENTILESYYSKYFDIDGAGKLYPAENLDNLYFDYDGLTFYFNTTGQSFTTTNDYIKYNLYNHLNKINPYLFDTGYTFLIDKQLNAITFTYEYFDERPNPYIYPNTIGDSKGTLIKIIPYISSYVNYFKNHTYVALSDNTGEYKSLIVDLVPNEYFVVETYKSNTGLTLNYIKTIYNLKEISDILYDVYINEENSYYRVRDDDMRRNICNGYASFISEDLGIIDNTTAFLMQDPQHKFVLKIYDPENSYNGGVVRSPYVITRLDITIPTGGTSAILKGEVMNDGGSNITERGICYSPDSINFTCVSATTLGLGPYTCNIYPLTPLYTYYYKAYAKNIQGIGYGELYTFTTSDPNYTAPTITTDYVVPYSHKLTPYADIVDIGWLPILERGFIYQTGITTPTLIDDLVIVYLPENGQTGSFYTDLTGLTHSTMYSINSYAINICGTTYGDTYHLETLYPSPPVINTVGYTNVTYNSMDVICNLISNDGELTDPIHGVNQMGVVYSNDPVNLPTTGNTVRPYTPISFGQFIVNLTGLTYSQNYYIRAYAMNTLYSGNTTVYGTMIFPPPATLPLPVAPTLTNSLYNYSTYYANVSNILSSNGGSPIVSLGLYYATGDTVTTSDTFLSASGTTSWMSNLTGLTDSTKYSYMAEAVNLYGLSGYTTVTGFTTLPIQTAPTGVTLNWITATPTGATLTGNAIFDGYSPIINKGILYSTSPSPTTPVWSGGSGTGMWTSSITGLTVSTTYYARAYATNSIGTTYSSPDVTFTTPSGNLPPSFSITSHTVGGISTTTATVTANILSDGGATVTDRGICFGLVTPSTCWNGGTGAGIYSVILSGLTLGTTYYVKAYATNSEGTTYTSTISFNTSSMVVPTVTLDSVSDITLTGVTLNSNVVSDGYSPVIARGCLVDDGVTPVYWPNGTGTGVFVTAITGLTQNTSYTGISYAENSIGTAWSDYKYFNTLVENDVSVSVDILSASSASPYLYQVGDSKNDLIVKVEITTINEPPSNLFDGDATFTSGITVMTWGSGVKTINNSASPFTYAPLTTETKYFIANENCGVPTESRTGSVRIDAVYPYLTCNRSVSNPMPPSNSTMATWCSSGSFYTGMFPLGNEPMLKKIELPSSSKTYNYYISNNKNVIYFACKADQTVTSLSIVNSLGQEIKKPWNEVVQWLSYSMSSSGLANNWNVPYNIYGFMVTNNLGSIYVTYNF